jgi:MFS family permease
LTNHALAQDGLFYLFGLLLVLIGGNQSELARALSIDLAQSGLLVSAFTLGAGIGIVGAGPIFDRAARRPLFLGALLWVALVLLTTGSNASYHETLLRLVAVGLGAVMGTILGSGHHRGPPRGRDAPLSTGRTKASVR